MKISLRHTYETIAEHCDTDADTIRGKVMHRYSKVSPDKQQPMKYAEEICRKIIENGGYNFINTHRDKKSLMELLSYYKFLDYFKEIITRDNGFPLKPEPDSYNYLVEKYNLCRADILAIGDRRVDIDGAYNAGLKSFYLMNSDINLENSNYCFDCLKPVLNLIY